MTFPVIFAGLTGPIPLNNLDTNFNYVTTTFMPFAGGTFTGPVTFGAGVTGTDFNIITLEISGLAALTSVTINGPLSANAGFFPTLRTVTLTGFVTATAADYTIVINKTVGAATVVNLPAAPVLNQFYWIKDGKGDAGVNNITVTPLGGFLIDGAATSVISTNYGAKAIQWNGTQWNVVSAS